MRLNLCVKIENNELKVSFITRLFGKKEATNAGMTDEQLRQFQDMVAGYAARDLKLKTAKAAMIQTQEEIARAATDPLFGGTRIIAGRAKPRSSAAHWECQNFCV